MRARVSAVTAAAAFGYLSASQTASAQTPIDVIPDSTVNELVAPALEEAAALLNDMFGGTIVGNSGGGYQLRFGNEFPPDVQQVLGVTGPTSTGEGIICATSSSETYGNWIVCSPTLQDAILNGAPSWMTQDPWDYLVGTLQHELTHGLGIGHGELSYMCGDEPWATPCQVGYQPVGMSYDDKCYLFQEYNWNIPGFYCL